MESIKNLLDELYANIDSNSFVQIDPVQIPRMFREKEDIEISAFLTSIIAWGNRKQIIQHAVDLMQVMNNKPYDFILNLTPCDNRWFAAFKHRTINGQDVFNLCLAIKNLYVNHGGLENLFASAYLPNRDVYDSLREVYRFFSTCISDNHTLKHISNVERNSAAKRLNLFLRWMVRSDGIDLGLWKSISPSRLYLPLDTHSAYAARSLGILTRKQNDWKAVQEITEKLRQLDNKDPIKYDLSLFLYGLQQKNRHR